MATLIKSNKAVNDVDNIFPYVSEFGETTQSLGRYTYERELAGSAITQAEFTALKNLEDALVTIGVFDKIIEFIPLMGSNVDSMMLKYKYQESDRMLGINSLTTSQIEAGKGLNLAKPTGTMPAVNMKLKQKYLLAKGHTSFIYYNSPIDVAVPDRTIFGAGDADADEANTVQVLLDSSRRVNSKFLGSNNFADDKFYWGSFLIASKVGLNTSGQVAVRELWDNGTLADLTAGAATITGSTAQEKEFYLGAKNGATSGGTKFFYGKIRLVLIFDGTITSTQIPLINTALQNFISATGKTLS